MIYLVTIWYKEKRTKEERRNYYNKLRKLGVPPDLARKVRDWSDSHIDLFLKSNGYLETNESWIEFKEGEK